MDASLLPRSICGVLADKTRLQFYVQPVCHHTLNRACATLEERTSPFCTLVDIDVSALYGLTHVPFLELTLVR